ncbi:hypothetical protein ACFWVB_31875 [Streptomyces microflavus]|uniref:hypothetical protein n=1 Tax=Streptomyces microflavus TaxID=1919 RepID=UPI00364707CF
MVQVTMIMGREALAGRYLRRVQDKCRGDEIDNSQRNSQSSRLAGNVLRWLIAAAVLTVTAWMVWAVVMVGGGITLAIGCAVLIAPWVLVYLLSRRRLPAVAAKRDPFLQDPPST